MKTVPMVDLKSQYLKIKQEIDSSITRVIGHTGFINGPEVGQFQKDLEQYLDVNHVVTCANGTDALQLAMMALDLKPGDEVITANFTFVATVEVIGLMGLTPVLVDVCPKTYTIDVEAIEKAITPKTKAIVPVHLFGQAAPMEDIMALAKKYNLYVVEDTAQALGADYIFADGKRKKLGTIGDIGTTSFFPSKNLGCYGDGGAIFTQGETLATKLKSAANHGMSVRYYHDRVGINSRLDTLQAAILSVKLKHLDTYNKARQQAAAYYNNAFADVEQITTPKQYEKSDHIFHQYTMVLNNVDREALQNFLKEKGIPAPVYYPVPLHLQKAYRDSRYKEGDFPVTEHLCETVLSLPIHTEMKEEDLKYISESVKAFFKLI